MRDHLQKAMHREWNTTVCNIARQGIGQSPAVCGWSHYYYAKDIYDCRNGTLRFEKSVRIDEKVLKKLTVDRKWSKLDWEMSERNYKNKNEELKVEIYCISRKNANATVNRVLLFPAVSTRHYFKETNSNGQNPEVLLLWWDWHPAAHQS